MENTERELYALLRESTEHFGKMENISRQLKGLHTLILMKRDLAKNHVKEALHAVNVKMASHAAAALLKVTEISKGRERMLARELESLCEVKTKIHDLLACAEELIASKKTESEGPYVVAELRRLLNENIAKDHSRMTHLEFVMEDVKNDFSLGYLRTTALDPNKVKITDGDGKALTSAIVGKSQTIKIAVGSAPLEDVFSNLTADLYDPNEEPVELTMVDSSDVIVVKFDANQEGIYQLEVKVYGSVVPGCPINIVATKCHDVSPRKRQHRTMLAIAQQHIVDSMNDEMRSDASLLVQDPDVNQISVGMSQLSTENKQQANLKNHEIVHGVGITQRASRFYGPKALTPPKAQSSSSGCGKAKTDFALQPPSMFQQGSPRKVSNVGTGQISQSAANPGTARNASGAGEPSSLSPRKKKNNREPGVAQSILQCTPIVIQPLDGSAGDSTFPLPSFAEKTGQYLFPAFKEPGHWTDVKIKTEKTESKVVTSPAKLPKDERSEKAKVHRVTFEVDSEKQDKRTQLSSHVAEPKAKISLDMLKTAESQSKSAPSVTDLIPQSTMIRTEQVTEKHHQNKENLPVMTVVHNAVLSQKPVLHARMTASFGKRGTGLTSMQFPIGLTSHSRMLSDVVMCDTGNHQVKIFTTKGDFKLIVGKDSTIFMRPSSVVTNEAGEIFVKDNREIQKFSPTGELITKFGRDFLRQPYGLALTKEGHLVTLDQQKQEMVVFDQQGARVREVPFQPMSQRKGQERPRFRFLTVSDQDLIAVDLGLHKVFVVSLLSDKILTTFGSFGNGQGQFNEPSGVTADQCGNLLVADSRNDRVQVFDRYGNFKCYVDFDEKIKRPSDIHMTEDGYLLVDNYISHQIKIYRLEGVC